MEGSVSGVDLSELMQARQELDQERGIETDPNMYQNYNPNRAREELDDLKNEVQEESVSNEQETDYSAENLTENQAFESEPSTNQLQTTDSQNEESTLTDLSYKQKDFSVYDSFSSFEIPDNSNTQTQEDDGYELQDYSNDSEVLPEPTIKNEEQQIQSTEINETDYNSNNIEKEDDAKEDDELQVSSQDDIEKETEPEINLEENDSEDDITENEIQNNVQENEEKISKLITQTRSNFSNEELNMTNEIIRNSKLEPIKKCRFIDIIGTEEFKNSGKLSYVLGKDEKGETKFGKLDKLYNSVIFSNENRNVTNLIYDMLFSLMLKNSTKELNLVVCDYVENSELQNLNSSSHMLFNRVPKNNKEILDIVAEVGSQVEKRYNLLAQAKVKSIEQYNSQSITNGFEKMPYILFIYNNFAESVKLDEGEKIMSSIYQLLRLGRMVGLYFIIVSDGIIENEKINYNLTTRIGFKTETESSSVLEIGNEKLSEIDDDEEIIVLPIETGRTMRLTVPRLNEIEMNLILKHIEG